MVYQLRLSDWQHTTRWNKGKAFSEVARAQHAVEIMYNQIFDKDFVFCCSHHYLEDKGKSRLFEDLRLIGDYIYYGQDKLTLQKEKVGFSLKTHEESKHFNTLDEFLNAFYLISGNKLTWKGKALEYLDKYAKTLI